MSQEIEARVEELEMQNAFMQDQIEKMEANLEVLNKDNYHLKESFQTVVKLVKQIQSPDYIQEILHNGSNR